MHAHWHAHIVNLWWWASMEVLASHVHDARCDASFIIHHVSCIMHHVCINVTGVPRGQYIPGTGTFAACLPPQASMPTDRSSRAESTQVRARITFAAGLDWDGTKRASARFGLSAFLFC